jgi:hypothetical protein
MMRTSAMAVLCLLLPTFEATAQVVTVMTTEQIDAAIAAGAERKPAPYVLSAPQLSLTFTTPYLRVAQLAAKTPNADRSLATPELIAPELRIVATPEPFGRREVVIKEAWMERSDGTRVKPLAQQAAVDYAQSSHGKITLRGVRAAFPVTAIEPGARFRFLMGDGQEVTLAPEPAWFTAPR